jgi:hypothetical protein
MWPSFYGTAGIFAYRSQTCGIDMSIELLHPCLLWAAGYVGNQATKNGIARMHTALDFEIIQGGSLISDARFLSAYENSATRAIP